MKRLAVLSAILVLFVGVTFTHTVDSAPKSNKVKVCHNAPGDDVGEVIDISSNGNAVTAHITNHNDCRVTADLAVGAPCDSRKVAMDNPLCSGGSPP